jgi:hypothetical protein
MTFSALRNFALGLFALVAAQACIIDPYETDCDPPQGGALQIDAYLINTTSSDLVLLKDTSSEGYLENIDQFPLESTRELRLKAGERLYLEGPRQESCLTNHVNAYAMAIDSVRIRYLADSLEVLHWRSYSDTAALRSDEPARPITNLVSWEDSVLVDTEALEHRVEIYRITPEDRKEAQRIGKPF